MHSNPVMTTSKLQQVIQLHEALLEQNPYCYFELAYTRGTMWMVWLCSNSRENDPSRKMLAQGQGETPEKAAAAAIESFGSLENAMPDASPCTAPVNQPSILRLPQPAQLLLGNGD